MFSDLNKKADRVNVEQEITAKVYRTSAKDGAPSVVLRGYGLGTEPGLYVWGSDGKFVGRTLTTADEHDYAKMSDPAQNIEAFSLRAKVIGFGDDLNDWIVSLVDSPSFGQRLALLRTGDTDPDSVNFVALREDLEDLYTSLAPGPWKPLPLKVEYVFEADKQPYYRTLPGDNIQVIGEIKHRDGIEFPENEYTVIGTMPAAVRPSKSVSWTVPTYGGTPTGSHCNIVVNGGSGGIGVNAKHGTPLKVELSGIYYRGAWPNSTRDIDDTEAQED